MQEVRDWNRLITELGHVRVQAVATGRVWKITVPRIIHRAEAVRERSRILEALTSVWPCPALWASENDGTFRWSFPDPARLQHTVATLYEGEWVLLFFDTDAHLVLRNGDKVPTEAKAFIEFVSHVKARAGILSWVDDDEWLAVVK